MDLRLRLLWYCSFIADVLLQFFLPEFSRCLHSNTSSEFIDRLMLPICQPQDFNNWQVNLRPTTTMRPEVGIRRLSTRRLKLVARRRSETMQLSLLERNACHMKTVMNWRSWQIFWYNPFVADDPLQVVIVSSCCSIITIGLLTVYNSGLVR